MATVTPKTANWFTYFPEDYRWSSGLCGILGGAAYGGSELGEVDRAGRLLKKHVGDDNAWFETWRTEGDRARSLAEAADKGNRRFTASGAYLRACNYYQMAERFRTPKDEPALDVYRQSVECFHRFARLTDRPRLEVIEVPYEKGSLPASQHCQRDNLTAGNTAIFDWLAEKL